MAAHAEAAHCRPQRVGGWWVVLGSSVAVGAGRHHRGHTALRFVTHILLAPAVMPRRGGHSIKSNHTLRCILTSYFVGSMRTPCHR